jgi:septal ring factor EnvC (AmiA/AmiB activator)
VISAHEGADIHAVAAGRVVYADWLRGYGLMVIVEHGKGYMSLYAFNQSLHKSVGEQVKAGETLASVGRSGGRSQAALYFGIRSNGRPVDPEHWCRKPAKN